MIRRVVAGGLLTATAITAVGYEHYRPCEDRSGCVTAANLLGYGRVLSGHNLVYQDYDVQTGTSDTHVYNLTRQAIGKKTIASAVNYYEAVFAKGRRQVEVVHPSSSSTQRIITTAKVNSIALHDVIVVPENTVMPYNFNSAGLTRTEADQDISVSVVRSDTTQQFPVTATDVVFTELCQATTEATTAQPVSAKQKELYDHLAQETVCNSFGSAMADAYEGYSYDDYLTGPKSGYVQYYGADYRISLSNLTSTEFAGMAAIFNQ